MEIMETRLDPPAFSNWTDSDGVRLAKLKKLKINIKNTALGRHQSTMKKKLFASAATMTAEEMEALRFEMETYKDICAAEDNMDPPQDDNHKEAGAAGRVGNGNGNGESV